MSWRLLSAEQRSQKLGEVEEGQAFVLGVEWDDLGLEQPESFPAIVTRPGVRVLVLNSLSSSAARPRSPRAEHHLALTPAGARTSWGNRRRGAWLPSVAVPDTS